MNKFLMIFFILFHISVFAQKQNKYFIQEKEGAVIRADTTQKNIYLILTAHDFGEGIPFILHAFDSLHIKASFFLTGDFVRKNPEMVKEIYRKGHYVGPHSDKHLLYCDWTDREKLLMPMDSIITDLKENISTIQSVGIPLKQIKYFMPPYEWYNKSVYAEVENMNLTLINFTPGTSSNADYTTPDMKSYVSSDSIFNRIFRYEKSHLNGLNGFYLLIHAGTDQKRKDKLYLKIPVMVDTLRKIGYGFKSLGGK